MREIEEIRRSGIAFDDGEFNAEVRCVAVPVKDFTGQTIGALGISGPIWRLSIQALQSRAKIVQAAADRLSADLRRRRRRDAPGRRPVAVPALLALTAAAALRKYHPTIENRLSHSRICRIESDGPANAPIGRRAMTITPQTLS